MKAMLASEKLYLSSKGQTDRRHRVWRTGVRQVSAGLQHRGSRPGLREVAGQAGQQ